MLYTIFEVLKGVPNTLIITIVAIIFGLIIGTLFAIIRLKNVPVLSQLIIIYNSFFRSTPLIVQLFIVYYGLPSLILLLNDQFNLSINPDMFSPLIISLIVFSLHAVAYLSESIKGGLQSVENSQIEAAQTVGLSKFNIYRRIVLPQAFGYALP
ncbi:ABC transporter permease, partial [Staphylococcus gallinarum]